MRWNERVAIKPKWEKYFSIDGKPCRLVIEMGLSEYELVLYADDARIVLGKKHWHPDAEMLPKHIAEGLDALRKL